MLTERESRLYVDRAKRAALPVVLRLRSLAREFDDAAEFYSTGYGVHNSLLYDESRRAASQLRCVATFVVNRAYSEEQGFDWVRAAHRIILAIGRSNLT